MEKIVKYWCAGVVGILLGGIYLWGASNMYFHQDDLDWFLLANRQIQGVLAYPIGDHVNYLFRLLISFEWNWFGFNFEPYLAVSMLMHGCVVWLIYKLAKASSGRSDLAGMAAVLFSVNTNWTETVLWVSGQTILITAMLVLLTMFSIWREKSTGWWLLFSSWTSALALGLLGSVMMVYQRLRWQTLAVLGLIGFLYASRGGDGTSLPWSVAWVGQVLLVAIGMFGHTVVGRLLIPFDRFELWRIGMVVILFGWGLWKGRKSLAIIWQDIWSRFLLIHISLYYLIVAAGRAQYGVGIMRAERYAYIGLALLLLLVVRVLRKVRLGGWVWIVPLIVSLQILGFYIRSTAYVKRPQQLKTLVQELQQKELTNVEMEAYLPRFVLNDDRLKYSDLMLLIKD